MQKNEKFPKEACAYEKYDADTLIPSNNATFIRLMELGWTSKEFEGKSVLDIGCNTGALSIYALSLGASKVKAIDVQDPLLDFFSQVVNTHKLAILVEKKGFNQLSTNSDSADIVLLMEVLHWLIDQGATVRDSIKKLASLANEAIYIETPWDINEPSIAAKGKLTSQEYNMDLIISELTKYFAVVKFERFMTYFGRMEGSRRVLISASQKRVHGSSLDLLDNANLVGINLSRGVNPAQLVTTPDGPMVIKAIPNDSIFTKLSHSSINKLANLLLGNTLINAPLLLGDSYVYKQKNGLQYMLFSFCGKLSSIFPKSLLHEIYPCQSPLKIAIDTRKLLKNADVDLINAIAAHNTPKYEKDITSIINKIDSDSSCSWSGLAEFLQSMHSQYLSSDLNFDESIVHGDIQIGNIIEDDDGEFHVIDLDFFKTGPIYSDLIITSIFAGSSLDEIKEHVSIQQDFEERPFSSLDVLFSVNHILGWLEAVANNPKGENYQHNIESVYKGLMNIRQLYRAMQ